mmetsp:Transcript_90205/g.254499  ORF Transcript_90205/g.254499 Transcript_90205/m.254499 type:complete len:218 (+) Transcript_90205:420-1073(+)
METKIPRLMSSGPRPRKKWRATTSGAAPSSTHVSICEQEYTRTWVSSLSKMQRARTSSRSQYVTMRCNPVWRSTMAPTSGPHSATCRTSPLSTMARARCFSHSMRHIPEVRQSGPPMSVSACSTMASLSCSAETPEHRDEEPGCAGSALPPSFSPNRLLSEPFCLKRVGRGHIIGLWGCHLCSLDWPRGPHACPALLMECTTSQTSFTTSEGHEPST